MAVVKGVKEKVHLPLYDAVTFKEKNNGNDMTIAQQINGNVLKFFVNIQDKTKLETNQQEAGVLSHYNTYEARAMRVIVEPPIVPSDWDINLKRDEMERATNADDAKKAGAKAIDLAVDRLCRGDFLSNFIYNSVTSFIVGEKVMIQAPTWFFPSGAGPSNDVGITHGTPSPEATFRFAEPVFISHQQNFRAEIEFPNGVGSLGNAKGEIRVWVVVDGYLTRDVQ